MRRKVGIALWVAATALFAIAPSLVEGAEDGAALYKAKCSMCHGADAKGKPAAKIPSLVSGDAKKMSDAGLTDAIANGGKSQAPTHAFAKKGLDAEQIKALVGYLRTLQKQK